MVTIERRWGGSEHVKSPSDELITSGLLRELRTEPSPDPDDEHTQVSVANEHWSITVDVSGLITFDNIDLLEGEDSDLPETMYLSNLPDDDVVRLWQAVFRQDEQELMSLPWSDEPAEIAPGEWYYRRP